jgi:hypothetical protein
MQLKSEVVTSPRCRVANSHSGFGALWWGSTRWIISRWRCFQGVNGLSPKINSWGLEPDEFSGALRTELCRWFSSAGMREIF